MRKPDFCICENKSTDLSAFVFRLTGSAIPLLQNFKLLTLFCTGRSVSGLVKNPEDKFSHEMALMIPLDNSRRRKVTNMNNNTALVCSKDGMGGPRG